MKKRGLQLVGATGRFSKSFVFCMMFITASGDLLSARQSDLMQMSIQELMNIEVTSVSKKQQKISETAAAVFVITQEDIRRSGATNIPDLLRMVPGLEVARIDANKWAVSSRGFNARSANKLLVLMDGRSVYNPIYSGVFWDVQDTVLADVERIEVIRGPGASIWGANAVNGVINIITKSARDTQGGLIEAGGGTEERGFSTVRYGGKLNENAFYRIYAKYFNRDAGAFVFGDGANDDWQEGRSGFRVDWQSSPRDSLTLQGDVYKGGAGQSLVLPSLLSPYEEIADDESDMAGANVLGRWKRSLSDTSGIGLQVYYDWVQRDQVEFGQRNNVFDIEGQHLFAVGERQEIIWGLGYRLTHYDTDGSFYVSLDPDSSTDSLFSAFVQDEIALVKDRLHLTLGSKFEHNDYSGFEVQPTARLLYKPVQNHEVWAAVSRAVRTPTPLEQEARFNAAVIPPDILVSIFGSESFEAEDLLAYELGYRSQITDRLSLDIATFYNAYSRLRAFQAGTPFFEFSPSPAHLDIPLIFTNDMDGESYGVEVAADWRLLKWWRLQAAYTFLQLHLKAQGQSLEEESEIFEGTSPEHQFSLRSSMDLPKGIELDLWLRYVDDLPILDVDSYITLDARLAWRPMESLELSLVGQNLLDGQHLEYDPELEVPVIPAEVERSGYVKVTWYF